MKEKILILFILSVVASGPLSAQAVQADGTNAGKIQPKIMVIPRIKDGENMKAVYDGSMNIQIALAKINEAFLKRGANIILFVPKMKQVHDNLLINKSSGNTTDFKARVLQESGADIYVEAKMEVVPHPARNANSVTVILEGYQNGTNNLLGSHVGTSRINQTSDIGMLTMQALDSITEAFLQLMQLKFDDIVANGQSVYIEFTVAPDSDHNLDTEVGPDKKLLSEVLDEWFQQHAVNGVFNIQGVTTNQMILSDVRIPFRNPANRKLNYMAQNLYTDLLKYLRTMGVEIKRELGDNNRLMLTIK